ncbi:hypothetical protein B484DRAFT_113573 [Ochromonadaceae sp. CCMP2298]|nr:hypothetical protein B484DRAFT_113573 [Ochromonadaceae sp. CCMP2298]
MLAAGDVVMCRYVMQIDGCTNVGGDLPSFSQQGMIQCRFDREDKILSVEMMFDVMGYMQQLQRAGGISPQNTIVPNTLDMALQPTTEVSTYDIHKHICIYIYIVRTVVSFGSEIFRIVRHIRPHPDTSPSTLPPPSPHPPLFAPSHLNSAPTTLHSTLHTQCQAIVDAHMPYPIQQVNGPWADVTGLPQAEATGMVLFQALRVYPFQNDLICRLASDCAAGRPGSAIVLVMEKEEGAEEGKDCAPGPLGDAPGSSWEASGSGNGGNGREIAPLVRYIKLLPLTSDSDRVTHFSATLVDIPLTAEETREAAASVTSMLSSNADGFSSLPSLSNSHNSHTSRNNSNSHNSHNSNDASTFTSSSDSPESEQFGQFYPQEAYFQQDQGQGQYKQARYDSQVGGQGGLPFAYSAAEQLQMSQMGGDFYPFFQQSMGALEGVMDGIDGMEEQGESVDTGTSEESYEAAMRSMQPMNAAMRDRGDRGEAMGRGAKGPRQAELSERGVDSRSALAAFNQPFI